MARRIQSQKRAHLGPCWPIHFPFQIHHHFELVTFFDKKKRKIVTLLGSNSNCSFSNQRKRNKEPYSMEINIKRPNKIAVRYTLYLLKYI